MMWWWHGASGWDWFWMSAMMVVFWALVGVAIYAIVRSVRQDHTHDHSNEVNPEDILARRFARGEITREQYEEGRRLLAS